MKLEDLILEALEEKEIFIGYYMFCRYLNGKGYVRYGCNAGYNKPFTNGKDRLHPCKILCLNSEIYHSRVRYWCKKLAKKNKIFLIKRKYHDSNNPHVKTKPHNSGDIFVFICLNEETFGNYLKNNTLEAFI